MSDPLDGLLGPATGRRPAPIGLQYMRDLTEKDLADSRELTVGSKPAALTKITFKHHAVAQMVAQGRPGAEISALTGYTQSRISVLKGDPTFQELVTYYASQHADIYAAAHEKLAQLGITAVDTLQERLEDSPEDFSVRETLEVAQMALDRSVAPAKGAARGPTGAPSGVSVNISFKSAPQEGQILDVIPTKSR